MLNTKSPDYTFSLIFRFLRSYFVCRVRHAIFFYNLLWDLLWH
jgi:hypothetical protein